MTKVRAYLFILLITAASLVGARALQLEIIGGQNQGIPITVVPFKFNGRMSEVERSVRLENISNVIRNDLHNSGHFNSIEHDYTDKLDDLGYWKNSGITHLVSGEITQTAQDRYNVSFKLVDLYNPKKVLSNMMFRDKSSSQLRALAHHISDLIFKQLTGVRGFFSTKIAYITVDYGKPRVHSLVVADADGYNDQNLLTANYPIMSPRWSPDGRKIAFVSFRGHRSSVNVVDLSTGNIEVMTKYPGINGAPAWSPDGSKLALVLSKDGVPKIYILELATKALHKVTSGGGIDTEPFWHPDGKSLVFTSNRTGKPQIYRVDIAGGKVSKLTFTGDYNASPALTADARSLIMLHKSLGGGYNIAVQDMKTGSLKLITRSKLNDSPTLAPNGMMVLYGMQDEEQSLLGAVTLDGKFRMRLPIQGSNVKEPSWSPFLVKEH